MFYVAMQPNQLSKVAKTSRYFQYPYPSNLSKVEMYMQTIQRLAQIMGNCMISHSCWKNNKYHLVFWCTSMFSEISRSPGPRSVVSTLPKTWRFLGPRNGMKLGWNSWVFRCQSSGFCQHVRFQDYTLCSKRETMEDGAWRVGMSCFVLTVSFRWEYKQTELNYDFLWGCLMRLTAGCIIDKVRHLYVYHTFSVLVWEIQGIQIMYSDLKTLANSQTVKALAKGANKRWLDL